MYAKKRIKNSKFLGKEEKKISLYHVTLTSGTKGAAVKKYDYIMRERSYGKKYDDLLDTCTLNMPHWAKSGRHFFEMADRYERANGVTFKQLIIALPAELSPEENIKIAEEIAQKILGTTKAGCWAIHSKPAVTQNITNIHMHLMLNDRIITDYYNVKKPDLFFRRYNSKKPEKGGYQKDDRFASVGKKAKAHINSMRKEIEDIINEGYKKAKLDIRVSHKSLKDQYDDAIKKGDYNLAETLKRKPIKFLGLKTWKKIQSILEANNAIDFSQPIPLMPNKNTLSIHQKILNDNPEAYLKFYDRLEILKTKLEFNSKNEPTIQTQPSTKTLNYPSYLHGYEYQKLLNNLTLRLQTELQTNIQYNNLYKKIYSNAESISEVINNVITRGRLKRYLKTQQLINQIKSQMQNLLNENRIKPDTLKKYDILIEDNTKKLKELEIEITKISNNESTKKRFKQIAERLKKSFPAANKKYKNNIINQKIYLEIIDEITKINQEIKPEMTLPLNQNTIEIFKTNNNKDIKKIKEILKELKEHIDKDKNEKQKDIKIKQTENHKDDYSR